MRGRHKPNPYQTSKAFGLQSDFPALGHTKSPSLLYSKYIVSFLLPRLHLKRETITLCTCDLGQCLAHSICSINTGCSLCVCAHVCRCSTPACAFGVQRRRWVICLLPLPYSFEAESLTKTGEVFQLGWRVGELQGLLVSIAPLPHTPSPGAAGACSFYRGSRDPDPSSHARIASTTTTELSAKSGFLNRYFSFFCVCVCAHSTP